LIARAFPFKLLRMLEFILLAESSAGPSAAAVFYLTLLFIFLTAIITTVATKWTRDKCLKFFHGYHVTLERTRGQTIWGKLKVFSSGVEVTYDHPYIDSRGRKKTSFMVYGSETDSQILSIFRYHDELDERAQRLRRKQVLATFNPGPARRLWRGIRNFVNTLRDAFNAAIGAAVGQYQRMNPTSAVLSTQSTSVTQIGQTLIGKFATNAFEPLLEQYIGRPVILDVADPINPNNVTQQYGGYLADYTQNFIAIFNVEHTTSAEIVLELPDIERGEALPPLPNPPPPGAPAPILPAALKVEHDLAVRVDGLRLKIQNVGHEPMVVRRLEREGFEPLEFGMVLPPNGVVDLPARDARSGRLFMECIRCVDLVTPRKYATVRHAGELVARTGLVDELDFLHLDSLPLVPRLWKGSTSKPAEGDSKEIHED
jgi:hypothetical protein